MNHVKGLAPKTRRHYLCITRRLLSEQFSGEPVVISTIKPEDVHQFINRQKQLYTTSGSVSLLISALRGYFRYRTTCGDQVNHLIGVANYPANWQLSSLPKALSSEEIECLLKALDYDEPSALRTKTMVHCALDLGLRGGKIANLGLDDINWQAGTIILKKTKSRREDIMPLPEATGAALAEAVLNVPQSTGYLVQHVAQNSIADRVGIQGGSIPTIISETHFLLGGDIIIEMIGITIEHSSMHLRR